MRESSWFAPSDRNHQLTGACLGATSLRQEERITSDETNIVEQDFVNDVGPTTFQPHFEEVIQRAELEKDGDPNVYFSPTFSPTFIPTLLKYFLPQAALWSGLLLGDLGRHGTGPVYDRLTKRLKRTARKPTQNYTEDNKTQGIMEKSQWDLKKIRFQRRRLTRLDDVVYTYKITLNALLREYSDSMKRKKKRHRVDLEWWKQRHQKRRGVYVSPLTKPFVFKRQKKKTTQKNSTGVSTSDQSHAPLQVIKVTQGQEANQKH
ncbi:uncharacterized protein LOC117766380 [Hippoglossus hippoglossus]|uniref:uncharacterized protein LOC117766380 n=1 Tax=Hippoglossus hippoglossus TaxID=8267 RepID=UPI00148C9D92|nr:uncharacterized protein LOC117766380 [Hippoglossus hippoglossus]